VDIIFKGRHTDVLERFRKHATAKLIKIERLSARAIRVDVEVSAERNPRQSGRKERVELTITSSGPAIRAEAAAEDRFAALDMALAKLESRLRRANDRRKGRHGAHATARLADLPETAGAGSAGAGSAGAGSAEPEPAESEPGATGAGPRDKAASPPGPPAAPVAGVPGASPAADDVVQIEMDGDGPLVVREKFHGATPMGIDQALLEMELVGHDFFLFRDVQGGLPSVVYRRRGYQYGVIRLVDTAAAKPGQPSPVPAGLHGNGAGSGQPSDPARLGAG
jgi:ribosomal subunit interface protein